MEEQNVNLETETNNPIQNQTALPNSTGVLVMGILSIALFCCCYGIVGLVLGIIALVQGKKATAEYNTNPDLYTEKSFSNVKTGTICAKIGIAICIIVLIAMIIWMATGNYFEMVKEMMEKFESGGGF